MLAPLHEPWSEFVHDLWHRGEGRSGVREHVGDRRIPALYLGGGRGAARDVVRGKVDQRPEQRESEREQPALVDPAVVVVRCRQCRRDREETLRALPRGQQLRAAHIRHAVHADATVAPRLVSKPCDRVRPVARLRGERNESPLAAPAPPHILDHHGEARVDRRIRLEQPPDVAREHVAAVIWRALQQHGARSVAGTVHVGGQYRAVGHRNADASLDRHD
jgi:hypothetical protein